MSWVGSLINVGAVIGCLFGGALMDRSGRKMTLVLVFLLFTAGWLFIMLAVDPSMKPRIQIVTISSKYRLVFVFCSRYALRRANHRWNSRGYLLRSGS